KPVTTSVPSISIRFHANAEQIEELYASDDEHQSANESSLGSTGATGVGEPESSPLKYLPRLVKRSTSIDITPTANTDASPPSDPWRFFSDIKGKITKSVEDKITEIKSRNQDEGSPLKAKAVKDSKDNSSVSDSEDLSESSISKTCGIVSTTEGAEMSSDDDTPSIEKDRKTEERAKAATGGLRQRFRLLKPKSSPREGTISKSGLAKLYNINTDKIEQALPEESEIESAVDALEDANLQSDESVDPDVLKRIEEEFDNIKIDKDDVINVKEVSGSEVKQMHWVSRRPKTVYSPVGFVDMRAPPAGIKSYTFLPILMIVASGVGYFLLYRYSNYLAGIVVGVCASVFFFYAKCLLDTPHAALPTTRSQEILEVQAVQEFQPLTKYEGWVNEFPEMYNPHTYHISQTQSVYLRLQGNLLRLSHTRSKVPKRALWNEPKINPVFTHHRVYNLLEAKVALLPEGLAKKRHWSKKYPICVTLNKDQMQFESSAGSTTSSLKLEEEEEEKPKAQRFSKLTEENEEYELDSENSRASTPSPPSPDLSVSIRSKKSFKFRDCFQEEAAIVDEEGQQRVDEALDENLTKDEDDHEVHFEDDFDSLPDDWGTFTPPDESPTETKLFIFGRTDREKEDWFRRLTAATHKGANVPFNETADMESVVSTTLINTAMTEMDYIKYMQTFNKIRNESSEEVATAEIQWINAFVGRVLFDCLRDDSFTGRVKDKIQRKMASIKLPYFIEELSVTELSLGRTPPLIHKATRPMIDERGLWIDLDVTYEGLVILILQTKLNLMKLKQPHSNGKLENVSCLCSRSRRASVRKGQHCYCADCSRNVDRPAMFNSDVEDSAESTSDEEAMCLLQNQPALDSAGLPVQGLGGSSNTSKKFMKMVDRIAESKIFQAATEYRYIKKAMEGVSNTDLRLRVEVKELVGTLVLNIPPPPSDRVWVGFRPTPDLALSAQPIVGERNITFLRITSWIEKKLLQEFQVSFGFSKSQSLKGLFQKLMVIPNMEDFIVPVMSPNLPQ
ncbi:testis-expressed sequence 2 protein, partial [Asbolus verrucosus]